MNRVKALILAAGVGSRLRPITDDVPKCLVPLDGRPLLDYWLDLLGDAAVRDVLINTHSLHDQVQRYIRERNAGGCRRICEAYEPVLLGSAGTISANERFADDADLILVIYADNLSDVDLGALIRYHRSHDDPLTMMLFHAPDPRACGIAEMDRAGRVLSFVEKPEAPASDLANAGVYVVDAVAYREIAAMGGFDLGKDVLPAFVGRMRGWTWAGYHRDIGTPEAYRRAQQDAARLRTARGVRDNGSQPAVFFDRDGTLIEPVHYIRNAADVTVVDGVPDALRSLRAAGYRCVVVSNQSAVGRGLVSEAEVAAVNEAMHRQLAESGAVVDALYTCPAVPRVPDRVTVDHYDRKPGPGMLLRAARELNLSLGRSWMIGDMISDALAGYNAGCAGSILVSPCASEGESIQLGDIRTMVAEDIVDAADLVLRQVLPGTDDEQWEGVR